MTVAAVGAPLRDALEALIDQTAIGIAYDNTLVAGRTATCRAARVPLETALACVLRGTGLDFVRLSSGTYVLVRDPGVAPATGTLGGSVVDAETGAPLPGATVALVARGASEPAGTAASADGRFVLAGLLAGPRRIAVSYVGYVPAGVSVRVEAGGTSRVAVALQHQHVLMRPVVVDAIAQRSPDLGVGTISGEALARTEPRAAPNGTPGDALAAAPPDTRLSPTPDVTAALDAVVGVSVGQALADVHVQGGASGEHVLRLAGAPVFAPVSLGGLVGPFSPYAVERVTVHKAGFGADLGSALSGVVEVDPLRAPLPGQAVTAEVDALGVHARLGGRVGDAARTEASWVISGRQSTGGTGPRALSRRVASWNAPDPFLRVQLGIADSLGTPQADPADGTPVDLSFTDLHAAGRVRFGGLRTLSASFYGARHAFEPVRPDAASVGADELFEGNYQWSNATGSVRYEGVVSGHVVAHAEAWASGSQLSRPTAGPSEEAPDASALTATGVAGGIEAALSPRQWLTVGLEATGYSSEVFVTGLPGATTLTADVVRPLRATLAVTADDRLSLSSRTTLTLGARATVLPETGQVYAEPRAALRLDAPDGPLGPFAVRLASGVYRQFVGAYDAADAGLDGTPASVRFWLPVGQGQRPPLALHLAAEGVVQPGGGPWSLRAEGYVKVQPHLLVLHRTPAAVVLEDARGSAWGVALSAERRTNRLRLAATYELSVARIRQADRFGGAAVPAPWSVPHRLRLSADAIAARGLTLTVRAEALAGRPWGFRQAYYDLLEPDPATRAFTPIDLSDVGAHRLPLFAQVDLGVAYARAIGRAQLQGRVGLVNALGRANVRDWRLEADGAGGYRTAPRLALPCFPTAALQLTF